MNKIFVFGDSVSFGELVSSNKSWPSLLSNHLDSTNKNVLVQNFSKNGDTTRLALLRLDFDILKRSPEIVIVQFGINDCNIWLSEFGNSRVNIITFEYNLIEICKKIFSAGAKKVFLNTNHPITKESQFMDHGGEAEYKELNTIYNESIRKAYKKLLLNHNVHLIDIELEFNSKQKIDPNFLSKSILDDGIHLSEFGQMRYLDIIIKEIKSFLG